MALAGSYPVRDYREGDATYIADIMKRAIQEIGPRAYSPEQIEAWSSRCFTHDSVKARVELGHRFFVARTEQDLPIAYTLLEEDGHLDHLYCHPEHTRMSIANDLLAHAEQQARTAGCERLYTEASELARAAFERAGYRVVRRRDFTIPYKGRDVPIHNYAMEKALR